MAQKFCYGCMKAKEQSPICEHCGFDERKLNLNHQLPIGSVLNNQYILGRVLGQGGFGITYIGWDRVLDMPVAIKEYFPNGIVYRNIGMGPNVQSYSGEENDVFEKHKRRFMREARSLAQLASIPEVVQVKNFFEANNTAYIVMEYVDGVTLKNYMKWIGRPLTTQETMQIMDPVLRGLAAVHERELIHRDISPDNIMLEASGGVKIIDFGTVRYMNDMQLSKSTESVLKPGFAPMEQYNSKGNVGTWTDVYALCATYHYCLTGEVPPDAPSRLDNGEHLASLERIPDFPKHMILTLEKGMRIRISERTQTIPELFAQLHDPSKAPREEHKTENKKETGKTPSTGNKEKTKSGKGLTVAAVVAVAALIISCVMLILPKMKSELPGKKVSSQTEPAAAELQNTRPAISWKDNVLMKVTVSDKSKDPAMLKSWPAFGLQSISRSKICAVTFLDSTRDAPTSSWDVSESKNGSVLAWVEAEGDKYHLYLAGEGGINGKLSSEELFYHYENLERVEFNGCYHTDYATSFRGMFDNCKRLRKLDLTGLNSSKVLDMQNMFQACEALTELNIDSLDTSGVFSMNYMFNGTSWAGMQCIDFNNFKTDKVREYNLFFHNETLPGGKPWRELFVN